MLTHSFRLAMLPLLIVALLPVRLRAELPAPPQELDNWSIPWDTHIPGPFAADGLLHKPAGRFGPVIVRNGHFYTGDRRIRFWGVNVCFSGAFPTHAQADAIAKRLARFGINAVRFHHMDMRPFPGGIFADRSLEKLSPEALDRLDYFIAALKREGIYSNINLHVSRTWSKAHNWPNADKLESFDKMLDLFHPELIAAQKQFARDLLGHVNSYTETRYADEPAIAMVEITNEDTMFLWGGEMKLARLPEPYGSMLTQRWNQWLLKKYPTRAQLAAAWNAGLEPLGPNRVRDPKLATLNQPGSPWHTERHDNAKMTVSLDSSDPDLPLAKLAITAVSGTAWHLQFNQPGLALKQGQTYTLSFRAKADQPTTLDASVGQAHAPWQNLGLSYSADVRSALSEHHVSFVARSDEPNARINFAVGREVNTLYLGDIQLRTGSPPALGGDEDPAQSTVRRPFQGRPASAQRAADWYEFVQATDEAYFVEMYRFLKDEIGVRCPITGTIGLGPLGTLSQSKMDFVDDHSYWDHPRFPGSSWSSTNWLISNKPMVDHPAGATFWGLAATRVAGKPFTVTEYNHSAPNEWQAECIPLLAAYAALQDWDGIFIFSYCHNDHFQKTHTTSFFDIEGNPLKLPFMPLAARIFLGQAIQPLQPEYTLVPSRTDMLRTGSRYYSDIWGFLRDIHQVSWEDALHARLAVSFDHHPATPRPEARDLRVRWTSAGPATGTGQFIVRDPKAIVFAGFADGQKPIDLGFARLDQLETPFAAMILVPADPSQTLASADRLLLAIAARSDNLNMQWDNRRQTISNRWGTAPSRIEVVQATLSLQSRRPLKAWALTPSGQRAREVPMTSLKDGRIQLQLGRSPTLWYEIVRQ